MCDLCFYIKYFYLYLGSVLAPCGNNATFMLSIEPLFNSFATLNASSKVLTKAGFIKDGYIANRRINLDGTYSGVEYYSKQK